jgi:hypothetical protein
MIKVSAFISNFLRIDYLSRQRAVVDKKFLILMNKLCVNRFPDVVAGLEGLILIAIYYS